MSNDAELLAIKRRKLDLLREEVKLIKSFGLPYYRPHKKQAAFHAAGHFKHRAAVCGNRFGKSTLGCAEDCGWLLGERVWLPKGDPLRTLGIPQRPVKGLVITTDWDKVDEIWTTQDGARPGKLWQFLPADGVAGTRRNHSGAIDTVNLKRGSLLKFDTVKSFMSNPQGSESSDWDFIHVDEPCPQAMYKAAARGLIDRGGSSWFTLTAISEVWIVDMFIPKFRSGDCAMPEHGTEGNKWFMRGTIYDNPYLSREAIDDYASTLTEDEIQCRLHGVPLELSGLIYKEFDFGKHVLRSVPVGWSAYNNPPADYCIYGQLDPHPKTPHAFLLCAVDPFGRKFIFDEIWQHSTVRELATEILRRTRGRRLVRCCMDPLGFINDPITGTNMAIEFEKYGVFLDKATKDLSGGVLAVKEELKRPDNLYFSPLLKQTLWEINRYMWDEKKGRPKDVDDHFMECLYRLCLMDPRYVKQDDNWNQPVSELEIDGTTDLADLEEAEK